jgi:serine/threonine-protein kinase RIM15
LFENILSGHIDWHDEWVEFSQEARDFMKALMTLDPNERLGAGGADEVKRHPFFAGIDWEKVTTTEAAFIPQVDDPESTDYFDPRGAIPQLFHDDDQILQGTALDSPTSASSSMPPPSQPVPITGRSETPLSGGSDDFGSFSFKNVPVLKQANDDVIRKLKTDQMAPISHALTEPVLHHHRSRSVSQRIKKPPSVVTTMEPRIPAGPPSPATSTSSMASSPSRSSLPLTPSSVGHVRKPSEYGAVERFKLNHGEGVDRRNTMPSRLRTASVSSAGDGSGSETWHSVGYGSPDPSDRVVTCLLAEDNPITAKIIETLLIRLGCRCVVVADGSEAISVAMGDISAFSSSQ